MIKQIILLALIGLAFSYPVKSTERFEADLVKIKAKLQNEKYFALPGTIDANLIRQIVNLVPNNFTANELIILAAQTMVLEIWEIGEPIWFEEIFVHVIEIIYALNDYGTGYLKIEDLRPFLALAHHELPELVDSNVVAQFNQLAHLTFDDAAHLATPHAVDYMHSNGINISQGLISTWYEVLDILKQQGTGELKYGKFKPLIVAALDLLPK